MMSAPAAVAKPGESCDEIMAFELPSISLAYDIQSRQPFMLRWERSWACAVGSVEVIMTSAHPSVPVRPLTPCVVVLRTAAVAKQQEALQGACFDGSLGVARSTRAMIRKPPTPIATRPTYSGMYGTGQPAMILQTVRNSYRWTV